MRDTDAAADRTLIELLRRAGPQRRLAMASTLTNEALWRARRGIANAHPELSQAERDLQFVKVHYGSELAAKVRAYLRAQNRPDGR